MFYLYSNIGCCGDLLKSGSFVRHVSLFKISEITSSAAYPIQGHQKVRSNIACAPLH